MGGQIERTVMTTTISIAHQTSLATGEGFSDTTVCTDTAEKLARFSFNPSGQGDVTRLKAIAAAFITECQLVQGQNPAHPNAAREAAAAITLMQQAAMMAVGAATYHLIDKK